MKQIFFSLLLLTASAANAKSNGIATDIATISADDFMTLEQTRQVGGPGGFADGRLPYPTVCRTKEYGVISARDARFIQVDIRFVESSASTGQSVSPECETYVSLFNEAIQHYGARFSVVADTYQILNDSRTATVSKGARYRELDDLRQQALASARNRASGDDFQKYADFLKTPNTGIVRLRQNDYYRIKAADSRRAGDFRYEAGTREFRAGFAGVDFGLFASLGQIDIRTVSDRHPTVEAALGFASLDGQPERTWRLAQQDARGTETNGIAFKETIDADVGTTYVLRSVLERQSDVVIVFQVVRRDPFDKSLILAWRIVKEFKTPVLNNN